MSRRDITIDQEENLFASSVPAAAARRETVSDCGVLTLLERGIVNTDGRFDLKMQAYLLQLAYAYNKILSLSNSRTKILAHQVESTHIIVNAINKRFIIADEVGLGKTVEAGLVIKEFIFRFNYKKILIAAPASLLVQWQHEMDEKFAEHFEIIDRKSLDKIRKANPGKNPWDMLTHAICSLDFIKNSNFTDELRNTSWDAVIFDEAHRLRRDSVKSTLAYNAAEIISERTKSLLLLTATPFRGKLEELFYLVRLADKTLLGPYQSFYNQFCSPDSDLSTLRERLETILIRRTKKEVGGFTVRYARTVRFELYPEERALYDATTRYVAEEFNRALQTENRAVGFVMTVFQKLLDSSSYALYRALKNRRENLMQLLAKTTQHRRNLEMALDDEFLDDLIDDAEDPDGIVTASAEKTAQEIEIEIATLDNLILLAESVTRNKKGEKLLEMIRSLKRKGYKKFLIFTQFKTTQDYLFDLLKEFYVIVFHGSMDKDRKEEAILKFKNEAEIIICTEAGGEGRNMQFCNILFNYDLPWSPLKIEQRIGRIHRFGQPYDVFIYNFSTKDTVAERVLDVLERKLLLFEESIGAPDIMLGQIEDEVNLSSLFMEVASGRKSTKQLDCEIEHSIERAKKSYEKLSSLTVTRRLDFNYDEYYRITQKERKFSNKQLESFIARLVDIDIAAANGIGPYDKKKEAYPVTIEKDGKMHYRYGTFDSELALADMRTDFLAFGHPSVDRSIAYCQSPEFGGLTGVRIAEHDRAFAGMLFNFVVTYRSIAETKEIVPVFVPMDIDFPNYEIEEIEQEILHKFSKRSFTSEYAPKLEEVLARYAELYVKGTVIIQKRANDKIWDLRENLDLHIDPEIDKINDSFGKELKELADRLERQEAQMTVSGRDMRGAITRTKNAIRRAQQEQEHMLSKYRRYLGISSRIELVNAAVVISPGNDFTYRDF